jgi:phosphohistidine phosphatase SixA
MLRYALAILATLAVFPAHATEAGWALLRDGGHVVLLRHARAQATSDPANLDIDSCSTQSNLTDRGRQQARKIGALFAARAASTEKVLSSRFCRTLETARLAFGDASIEPFDPLDPVAKDDAAVPKEQVQSILAEIRAFSGSGNLVMVTHLEIISALIGAGAREGEAVIVRPEGETLHVLGRIIN